MKIEYGLRGVVFKYKLKKITNGIKVTLYDLVIYNSCATKGKGYFYNEF